MVRIAQTHTDRLPEIKKYVEDAREYWQENINRYEKFKRFVFKSSLDDNEASTLASIGKPTIEFNILEAHISKLRGEFAKQEPSLSVRAADGVPSSMLTPEFSQTLDITESHLRAIFFDGANDLLEYNVYSDLLAGGFSVLRVYTKYINERSFEQNICVERVFDPTLTIFDPLARDSHKGDGRFCAEIYPMSRDSFEDEFGKEITNEMKFSKELSGFDWSFQNGKEEVVLVCDFYEKKTRKETIYKLSNGHSLTKKEYERFLEEWEKRAYIEQPPVVVKERKTTFEYICRYRFCESGILDYAETDFKFLPLVFVDGNSVVLKESGSYTQMTRPFVYHAEGIQRLKNLAGASLGNELENSIQHKFIVPIEAVPEDYQEAYRNVQKADVLLYNHYHENDPSRILPPPQVVQRGAIPPEITNTFRISDEMTQVILGNADPSQGIAGAQLSGIAIARSAIQSNNSSMPYIIGFIKGLNRVAQLIVDLIPKYYRTPRSLPILKPDGKRSFVEINSKKSAIYMNFDPNSLEVKLEVGINFAMQKEVAIQTIIQMSQANQGFAQFFNEEGLPFLLDNIDIRGIDQLKEKAMPWMQKQKQMQEAAAQQQQQQMQLQAQQQAMQMAQLKKEVQAPAQTQVELMMIEQQAQNDEAKNAINAQLAEVKYLEVMSKIQNSGVENELKRAQINAEMQRTAVESSLKIGEHINKTLEHMEKSEERKSK